MNRHPYRHLPQEAARCILGGGIGPFFTTAQGREALLYAAGSPHCCPLLGRKTISTIVLFEEIEGCSYRRPEYPPWRNEIIS